MKVAPYYLKNEVRFDSLDFARMTVDTPTLSAIIQKANQLAQDPRLSNKHRAELSMHADRMMNQLLILSRQIFTDGTAQLLAANSEIASVNRFIEQEAAELDKIAQIVEATAELVGVIDQLLKIIL